MQVGPLVVEYKQEERVDVASFVVPKHVNMAPPLSLPAWCNCTSC